MIDKWKVDLHIHTTASDGIYSAEEVVIQAQNRGLKVISFTDHDSVDNVTLGQRYAQQVGMLFIPGVEISTLWNNQYFHILGYKIDINNKNLCNLLQKNKESFEEKDNIFIRNLINESYDLNFEDYKRYSYDPARGGWKVLNFLIDNGICKNIQDYFSQYSPGGLLPFAKLYSPKDVIKVIIESQGKPIIAHPGISNKVNLEDTLNIFKNMGIQGIECYHPEHNEKQTKVCLNWCKKRNLIITGGSDYHGDVPGRDGMGKFEIYANQISLESLI